MTLSLTHSHHGQIRIQEKEIKSCYQVKGYKELQLQENDLRKKENTVNGEKKSGVKKSGLDERLLLSTRTAFYKRFSNASS